MQQLFSEKMQFPVMTDDDYKTTYLPYEASVNEAFIPEPAPEPAFVVPEPAPPFVVPEPAPPFVVPEPTPPFVVPEPTPHFVAPAHAHAPAPAFVATAHAPAFVAPAAFPQPFQYMHALVNFPAALGQNPQPVQVVNVFPTAPYVSSASAAPAAPCPSTSYSWKRENKDKQHDDGPYVKQPPNAFMIFMSMQRASVPEEIKEQGSAAVSVYLGDEWKQLTEGERLVYKELSIIERENHRREHPDWTLVHNYGKKRKRVRVKPKQTQRDPTNTAAVAEPVTELTFVMGQSHLQTGGMQQPVPHPILQPPPNSWTGGPVQPMQNVWMQRPNTDMRAQYHPQPVPVQLLPMQTPITQPLWQHSNLPQE